MRSHRIVSVLFAAILCSCDGGSGTTAPVGSGTPVSNPNSTAVFPSLVLQMQPDAVYEGMTNWLGISAFDRDRAPVSTDEAVVTSSDPSVAAIVDSLVIPMTDASNRRWSQRQLTLRLLKSGTTTLRVTLGSVDRSFVFNVAAVAPSTTALVVDSFTVIEYPACGSGSGCHYLFYAPLLKLREPTGKASAEVIGVEFTIPTKSTGMCSYSLRYGPGESAHVNGIDPDPWGDNPLIYFSQNGIPVPDGPAFARVLVRDSKGVVGRIEVTGTIQRMVVNPILPPRVTTASHGAC
jgi:hypothetical protein